MIDWNDFPYRKHFTLEPTETVKRSVFPREFSKGHTKEIKLVMGAEITADFSEETVGKCYFSLSGNGNVNVIYGESREELYSPTVQNTNDWYAIPRDSFSVTGGKKEYVSSSRRGFRYIRIICADGKVFLSGIRAELTHCAVKNELPYYSDDPQLNGIWDICRRTTLLCMQEFFEDGVKRDGILWISDARVQALCNYACFGENTIVKNSLMYIANSQRKDGALFANAILSGAHGCPHNIDYMFDFVKEPPYPDEPKFFRGCGMLHYVQYSVDFINMTYEYHCHSGDTDTVKALFPFMTRALEYLLSLTEEEIIKKLLPSTSEPKVIHEFVDQGGFPSTYYACLVQGLDNYIKMCSLLDKASECELAKAEKARYTEKVRAYFKDGICRDTDRLGVTMYPISAPTMAFLSGCITKDEYLRAMDSIKDKGTVIVDGYWKYFSLRAMLEAGLRDKAIAELRLYWGIMLDNGATTCFEHVDPDYYFFNDHFILSRCHGWSAGAADLMKRYNIV